MPVRSVLAGTLALALAAAACVGRTQPYRFRSPLLGGADVPPAFPASPGERLRGDDPAGARDRRSPSPRTPMEDPRPGTIRIASAEAAAAVAQVAAGLDWMRLPAAQAVAVDAPPAPLREPVDLRARVGRRDAHDSASAALGWSGELGAPITLALVAPDVPAHPSGTARAAAVIAASRTNTATLLAWARDHDRVGDDLEPGALLVFARTESDASPDLVALVVGRDARGVIEFVYCAGGVIRRGYLDRAHPAHRRDAAGAIENTFLRTGGRWPPDHTHYLAGELFVTAIRARSWPSSDSNRH